MPLLSSLSATLIALLMAAGQQLVLALGWCIVAALLRPMRAAALYWSAFGALTAGGMALFVVSVQAGQPHARAVGNALLMASLLALHAGIRRFFQAPVQWRTAAAALLVASLVSWFGNAPEFAAWRIAIVAGMLSAVCVATVVDVLRLPVQQHRWSETLMASRWRWALAAAPALGSVVFFARAAHAVAAPAAIARDAAANTTINAGSAFAYMVLSTVFQFTLMALVLSDLVSELRLTARKDALTGVANRRAIEEALADEAHRAQRLGMPFAVLMVDVDRFKAINDSLGHAGGDHVLQQLARSMSDHARDIDRVGRFGGEEFVIVMPGCTLAQAHTAAERLRARVMSSTVRWKEQAVPLTVSIGLAAWQPGDDVHRTLERADEALYRAKRGGRNRVEAEANVATA